MRYHFRMSLELFDSRNKFRTRNVKNVLRCNTENGAMAGSDMDTEIQFLKHAEEFNVIKYPLSINAVLTYHRVIYFVKQSKIPPQKKILDLQKILNFNYYNYVNSPNDIINSNTI